MTPSMTKKADFLLAGVGGQGIILASEILSDVGAAAGYDVKKSEVHGMSQRGGSVDSHVRWGEKVYSPVIPRGEVDYLLSFEMMEGARHLPFLAPQGVIIVSTQRVPPLVVSTGVAAYPSAADLLAAYRARAREVVAIDALGAALRLGRPQLVSTIMLGALSTFLELNEGAWLQVIEQRVPARAVAMNLDAFQAGRSLAVGVV